MCITWVHANHSRAMTPQSRRQTLRNSSANISVMKLWSNPRISKTSVCTDYMHLYALYGPREEQCQKQSNTGCHSQPTLDDSWSAVNYGRGRLSNWPGLAQLTVQFQATLGCRWMSGHGESFRALVLWGLAGAVVARALAVWKEPALNCTMNINKWTMIDSDSPLFGMTYHRYSTIIF